MEHKVHSLGGPADGISVQMTLRDLSRSLPFKPSDSVQDCVSESDLLRQVSLHLHRFAPSEITPLVRDNEVRRLAERLSRQRREIMREFPHPDRKLRELSGAKLEALDPSLAQLLQENYHYLGSYRSDGVHFGLNISGGRQLLSAVTLSPFDLPHLVDALPESIRPGEVMVLSRMLAFSWSPRNTISHTLSRVVDALRERLPHVKLLLTYLNPNLGFTGSSYKASNWLLFGKERKKRYLYFDTNYVTDRNMIELYGTADLYKLRSTVGDRITSSVQTLEPLRIYAYFLDTAMRRKFKGEFDYDFEPNSKVVG